jgi:two-component system, NtrC family, sensor kinase
MRRGAKPNAKGESKRPVARKSGRGEGSRVGDLEKRLAQALKHEAEAQEQQTATSEILRVISSSPTDVQPTFEAIARSARRLCEAAHGMVFRFDGALIHLTAHDNLEPEQLEAVRSVFPIRPGHESVTARAILTRSIIHVRDRSEDPELEYGILSANFPTTLSVPLLREGVPLGAITVTRAEVRLFSDKQVELLKTFADQAVIAIENMRLFTELQEKNRALTQAHAQVSEALEQQTATSEILRVISRSPTDVQPVFDTIVRSASRLCGGEYAIITRFDGELLHLAAQHNPRPGTANETARFFPQVPRREASIAARALIDAVVVHVSDVETEELDSSTRETYRRLMLRAAVAVPMVHEGRPIGVIGVSRGTPGPFSRHQIDLLQTFADQAVIAIENVRLFNETKNALERQTATSEILRVLAGSPTDLQPVLDALVESASRLCQAADTFLLLVEGDQLRVAAMHGSVEESARLSNVIHRGWVAGRAVIDAQTVHVEDLANAEAEFPLGAQIAVRLGHRTALAMPLFRKGVPIGALFLRRREVRPFSTKEIALLQTFADQAVIAIENVRLFNETKEALEQLIATSEILGVISQSPTDVQPVFDTIAARAKRLCDARECGVFRFDGELIHLVAQADTDAAWANTLRSAFPRPPGRGSITARAIQTRSLVHIPDVQADPEFELTEAARASSIRSTLSVPMIREGEVIGAITVDRRDPKPFLDKQIGLVKIFADQAVIAIENVRLFTELAASNREIAEKSQQLEVASQHKSEFLANMSHELRTPLNAVIGFSEVLLQRMFGELNAKQDEYLQDIYASGQHLLSLINDILDLSKIEAGRMELELTDFDLPTALDNALTLIRERAGRRGIALHLSIDERLGQMRADERKIRQVVLNVLSNAIKFTPEGGRIDVAAVPRDEFVEVSVSDSGIGIAPEDQEAVFEEFRQVGTAAKKVEGTGLGLSLSRKFIELHGGRIWVQSQLGIGSTFTFTIPVRRRE